MIDGEYKDCEVVSPQLIINPRDINNVTVDGYSERLEYNRQNQNPDLDPETTTITVTDTPE